MTPVTTKLLITGVPGTGKTTIANYLAEHHGYYHFDMEAKHFLGRAQFKDDPKGFLAKLTPYPKIVISWGFGPYQDRPEIEQLTSNGYTLVWLDGDRTVTFRNFMHRERSGTGAQIMEFLYYSQMQMIMATNIVTQLNPHLIDPFDASGDFRDTADVANEILNIA